MKQMLVWWSIILLCTSIDARVNRKTGATTTQTGKGTFKSGGTFTTSTSGGKRGATRTASSSRATGHSATTIGAKGTIQTTNTPTTVGTHTATSTSGQTKTVTNQEIAQNKVTQAVQNKQNEKQVQSLLGSGGLRGKLAAQNSSSGTDDPAKKRTLALTGEQSKQIQGAQDTTTKQMALGAAAVSQSSSDSSQPTTEPLPTASTSNALFEAEAQMLTGRTTVSSNAGAQGGALAQPGQPAATGSMPILGAPMMGPMQQGAQMAQPPVPQGGQMMQPPVLQQIQQQFQQQQVPQQ